MNSTDTLDKFILDAVGSNWQKIAMVIAKAVADQDLKLPENGGDAELISSRIDQLVQAGLLEVSGDTSNWRFSEVRGTAPSVSPA